MKPKQKKISHADKRNAPPEHQLPILDADEVAPPPKATAAQIDKVLVLGREQLKLKKAVDVADENLSNAKKSLQNNKENDLPKALKAAHITGEFSLGNKGYKVVLGTVINASIPSLKSKVENAEEKNAIGIAYMDKMAPDMVDTVVTIRYPKGTEKELQKLLRDNAKRKKPLELELSRTVNTGSLRAWIAKRDEAGLATDDTKLNIQRVEIAEVKAPKGKKDKI